MLKRALTHSFRSLVVIVGLAAATSAHSIDIVVLNSRFATDLVITETLSSDPSTITTRTVPTVSNSPISNRIDGMDPVYPVAFASAGADTFSVTTRTEHSSPLTGSTRATAQTNLSFQTLSDGLAPLSFSFTGVAIAFYSDGFVSLFDQTLNQSVFSFEWGHGIYDQVPWTAGFKSALLTPDPFLLSSHTYELILHASTNASMDGQGITIQLAGLTPVSPVPEPSTYALMLVGLAGLRFATRRKS